MSIPAPRGFLQEGLGSSGAGARSTAYDMPKQAKAINIYIQIFWRSTLVSQTLLLEIDGLLQGTIQSAGCAEAVCPVLPKVTCEFVSPLLRD